MSGHYPPGTWEGDPRAPWNAPEPPECDKVVGRTPEGKAIVCGEFMEHDGDEYVCPECGNTELDEESARAEAEIAKAEALRDDPPDPDDRDEW